MRFDERFLEAIKSRLRLSDVIGRTVKLRRQGREFVGLSPFNKEKSASFFVNDDKGFYHDFSSGKHGDLISFLQETERLSFPEAVERLAAEAGLALPSPDPRAAEAEQRRAGLQDWMDEAAKWFEAQLRRPMGSAARLYLDKRGLPEAERTRFRLGYAPANRTALKDHLIAKGAKPSELVDAGLLIQPEDGAGSPYDRFRDRIIFPIADGRGRLVSFGGRALDPEARAYRETLLDRFEQLRQLSRPAATASDAGRALQSFRPRGDGRAFKAAPAGPNPETATAATRLASAPPPLSAALAQAVLNRPELLDERLETISRQGFGDEGLDDLAQAIVRLRIESDRLDAAGLKEQLRKRGMTLLLRQLGWAAERSKAPFLHPDLPSEESRALWSQALDLSVRLQALERAAMAAKADIDNAEDLAGFKLSKSERDRLRRQVMTGEYGGQPDYDHIADGPDPLRR